MPSPRLKAFHSSSGSIWAASAEMRRSSGPAKRRDRAAPPVRAGWHGRGWPGSPRRLCAPRREHRSPPRRARERRRVDERRLSSASPSVFPSSSGRFDLEAEVVLEDDPAHERVAVRVQPARRDPDDDVACANAVGTPHLRAVRRRRRRTPRGRTRRAPSRRDARPSRRRAARSPPRTSFGDTGDDLLDPFGYELAARDVVEEEERLGAWHTRSSTTIATRSSPTVSCRPSACAISSFVPTPSVAATEYRLLQPGEARGERSRESADAREHLGPVRRLGVLGDQLDGVIAGFESTPEPL